MLLSRSVWAVLGLLVSVSPLLAEDQGLPIVEEHYDEIWVVHEAMADRDWQRSRAYFVRDAKIIAERAVDDQMLWSSRDGKFLLLWDDYGVCRRSITFDSLVHMTTLETPMMMHDSNPWWWMGRRMTDLKAPGD